MAIVHSARQTEGRRGSSPRGTASGACRPERSERSGRSSRSIRGSQTNKGGRKGPDVGQFKKAAEPVEAKSPATCKLCGVELTEKNTYATFRGRDRRCRDCHILYMRELRRKERLQREQENGSLEPSIKGEPATASFFSFSEDEI